MPMAPIVSTIEIDRPPTEVFVYVTDPTRFAEWQPDVVRTQLDGPHRFTTTRRIGRRERTMTQEISANQPRDRTTTASDTFPAAPTNPTASATKPTASATESTASATESTASSTEFTTRTWAAHGVDGPIRPSATVTVEPLDHGARSRVTFALDFVGHGVGVVLLPLVRRQARKAAPTSHRNLKNRLEHR